MPQRRIFFGGNYTLGQVKNHADSATALPANSLDPDAEWGPSLQDIRHRLNFNFNMPFVFGMRASFNGNAQSAAPYNITTGRDDNLDGVVNDRPGGVGRNAARGAARFDMTRPGQPPDQLRPGANDAGRPRRSPGRRPSRRRDGWRRGAAAGPGRTWWSWRAGGPGGPGAGGGNPFGGGPRFSAEVYIAANNILNRVNYVNFVGNIQSPFFGTATSAAPPRRIEMGLNFRFLGYGLRAPGRDVRARRRWRRRLHARGGGKRGEGGGGRERGVRGGGMKGVRRGGGEVV